MKTRVLGFSGQIASGKTTISQAVAAKLGWRWFGFGEFLRHEAMRKGLNPSDRFVLKRLGKDAIEIGWESFCTNVLRGAQWQPNEGLVLDGIRHIEAIQTLRKLTYPTDVRLIFVSTAQDVRKSRVLNCGGSEEIRSLDADALEAQVQGDLSARSDVTVDGALSVEECAMGVLNWLVGLGKGQAHTNDVATQSLRRTTD